MSADSTEASDGGHQVAQALIEHGVEQLFTLVGGHISPILVAAKHKGIRVVDVRHEATAAFAADAVSRLTGKVGVAAVTAGPGVTNTLTAIKNAQQAQSPLLLLGGATATILRGRGSLQDIDQLKVIDGCVKWSTRVERVADLAPAVHHGLNLARSGVPGPVFVECPVDLLYPETTVRSWYQKDQGQTDGLAQRALGWYLDRHLNRLFAPQSRFGPILDRPLPVPAPSPMQVRQAAGKLSRSKRPVLVLGSQVVFETERISALTQALAAMGAPVFLAGMARGLLGPDHALQMRSARSKALREADLVLVAGLPFDFRLNYGRSINHKAFLVAANRHVDELTRNRIPDLAARCDPGAFLVALEKACVHDRDRFTAWRKKLHGRDRIKDAQCTEGCERIDPLELCREVDRQLAEDSILVVDGGDFVATASYLVKPTRPLSWLDPGVFGTLGVGAGFALGAKLTRPSAEVWIIYGDGSLGYSLAEFDTFCRLGLPVIALVGNDASWAQIARDQIAVLGDDVATVLERTAYHDAAAGLGAEGILVERNDQVPAAIARAKKLAASGRPVLINAHIAATDFRKGSLSI